MTEIRCEHCGPTRIAPHDVNCPTRLPAENYDDIDFGDPNPVYVPVWPMPNPEYMKYVNQQMASLPPAIGRLDGQLVTVETHPHKFSPIMEKATDHYTVTGRRGAECFCGYNPHIDHPEAGRGQLFAYVGQHIKNESGI